MAEGPITFLMDNLGLLCCHGNLLSSNSKDQVFELVGELQRLKEFSILSRSQDVLQRRIIKTVHEVEDIIDSCLVAELVGIRKPFVPHELKGMIRGLMEAPHEFHSHHKIDEEKCEEVGRMQNPREDNVVGLKDELDTLIGYLMEDSDKLGVISITGMPGIGKTTMAWRIYNDTKIRSEFPCLVWVRVPQHFNIRDVCLNIMTSITSEDLSTKEYVELISMVSTYLMCKKFLIIMDDVWTSEAWNEIKDVLPMQNAQGKVLITTINDNVAIHANRDRNPHNLRFLKSEESWELLRLDAFGKTNAYPPELEELGKVIVDRCKGLPLSVVVAANFIVEKELRVWVPDQWRTLVDLADYLADHYACRNTLSRIYDSLPDDLKECFLYLAMFPKDTEIPVWKLIRLWIAEGFIRQESKKSLEEIGQENLKELRDRNLLVFDTVNICGGVKTCRIHGIVHEYCKNEAAKLSGFQEIRKSRTGFLEPQNGLSCYRRFCIHSCVRELFLERPFLVSAARSMLFFSEKPVALEAQEISSIISDFRLIRVLDAHAIRFPIFPSKITKLIHLRYITLSVDDLKILPESISRFWNLQTLVVSTASRTLEIKASIWKMTQLRHLKTKSSIFLQNREGEDGYNLQTLTKLSPQSFTDEVSKKAGNLVELGIRGRLSDSLFFGDLLLLEKLSLEHDVYPKDNFKNPLLSLPKPNTFPPKLKSLVLSGTYLDWMHMSTLGCLPALEVLKLKNNAFWGSTWETDGGFENLKALSIEQTNLKYWVTRTYSFHKLRTVEFRNCEQLVQIPEDLGLTLEGLLMSGVTKYAVAYARKIEHKMALKGSSRKIEQKMALEGSSSSNSKGFNDQAHFRHRFFQRPEEVVVTIFAKGIPSNCVVVDFGEQVLSVTIEVPGEEPYHFQPRLFGKIVPEKCRYDVMSTKIKIRLAKADAVHWTSLEFSRTAAVVQKAVVPTGSQTPTYPLILPQVKKEEKEEKPDGDVAFHSPHTPRRPLVTKVVLKLEFADDKIKQKAMKKVSGISGLESIAMDQKDKKLTVTGNIDPVAVVAKLRKICYAEIVSVGPAKEPEKKKEEPKKDDAKKGDEKKDDPKKDGAKVDPAHFLKGYPAYYQPYQAQPQPYYYQEKEKI